MIRAIATPVALPHDQDLCRSTSGFSGRRVKHPSLRAMAGGSQRRRAFHSRARPLPHRRRYSTSLELTTISNESSLASWRRVRMLQRLLSCRRPHGCRFRSSTRTTPRTFGITSRTSWQWQVRAHTGVIETKGREDIDVAHKDRAARIWCENASLLTGTAWRYLKVPQGEFTKLQPSGFAEVCIVFAL